MTNEEKAITGYPSIDKPWLKYYSEEAINAPLPEKTLYQYIYDNNKDYTSNTALNYFGRKISYAGLFDNIEKAAKAFSAIGIKAGDIVTIMSMHTPEVIYSVYALNRIGAIVNLVYMTLSEDEIAETVVNTASKSVMVLDKAVDKIEAIREKIDVNAVIVLSPSDSMPFIMKNGYRLKNKKKALPKDKYLSYRDFVSLGEKSEKTTDTPYKKDTPAIIVYTSGTTGKPKGVVLSNDNLNAVAHQYRMSGVKFERGETFFNLIPPFFGFGISIGIHLSLCLGLQEILWIIPEPKNFIKAISKYKPNHLISGPVLIKAICDELDEKLDYFVTFAGGGASFTPEEEKAVNQYLYEHGAKVKYLTGYGMTELGATVCTGMNHVYKLGTLGIPLPDVTVKIVDTDTGKELKINETGEMYFKAPNIMLGYYNNQADTDEIITQDENGERWIHTGDIGMVDEDGFVHFKGRKKRIFITKGKDDNVYKLFPMAIEELFSSIDKVKLCGTIVVEDPERINVAVSFVTMKDSSYSKEQLIAELMECAREKLLEHSVPVKIVVLDEMPLNPSGKIDYKVLEKMNLEL